MKFLLALAISTVFSTLVYGQTDPWKEYKKQHGKDYKESKDGGKEDARRKQLFLATDTKITKHNSQKNVTYKLRHNKFSDKTSDELMKYRGFIAPANATRSLESALKIDPVNRQLLDSLDYRDSSCMPPIKDQGHCGSCWAFSAITPIEFIKCKRYGNLVVLSEQQLVDCSTNNRGCNGGFPTNAWDYLIKAGSAEDSSYPYTATQTSCKMKPSMIETKISSYYYSNSPEDPEYLKEVLQYHGLISVSIAVVDSFYFYWDGVYNNEDCDGLRANHAVVMVGWGTLDEIDYWVVRNSWGSDWGMSGYILIERGINKCKIENHPAIPVIV